MNIEQSPDVVIVGAGIGGSALAYSLAGVGLSVVVLEKTLQHKDVVRGEWMAPWGVAEANQLGLTGIYMAHGAHRPTTHITYSDLFSPAQAEAAAMNMVESVADLPLCIGHPKACNVLNDVAVTAGATLCRGITQLRVTPGNPPEVQFGWRENDYRLTPRWVVAADGRNGVVAGQLGCITQKDPEHHLFSGMLVENAPDWPEELQIIATEGDAHVLAFPQGEGRVRIYLGWPSSDRTRLVGPKGPQNFLDSWRLACVPHSEAIVGATPASPCIAYPNNDAWVDKPVHPGVVLVGDAAGRNDPIIGQGLSVTHRDVRQVRDALLGNTFWSQGMFEDYVTERKERMRRLRITARLSSLRDAAFGPEGYALRQGIHERLAANEEFGAPFLAAFIGPEALPAEAYDDALTTAIVGQPIWSELP